MEIRFTLGLAPTAKKRQPLRFQRLRIQPRLEAILQPIIATRALRLIHLAKSFIGDLKETPVWLNKPKIAELTDKMSDTSIGASYITANIIKLHQTIKEFNKQSEKHTKHMLLFTLVIAGLTFVMAVLVVVQITLMLK
jgi:hypothetical protein